ASHSGLRYLLRLSLMPLAASLTLWAPLSTRSAMSSAWPLALSILPSACMRVFPVAEPMASFTAPFTLSIVPAICSSLHDLCNKPTGHEREMFREGRQGLDAEPAIAGRSSSPSPARGKGKGRRGGERQGNQERTRDGPHWLRRPFQAQRGAVESGEQIGGIAVNRHAARPA